MLSVSEAQRTVLENTSPRRAELTHLTSCLGRVLAEEVVSDIDSPPHDKSAVDGYAVRVEDLATGQATLTVVEEVLAGQTPTIPLGPGQATRIMTGAPVPQGAEAVVMVERTKLVGDRVEIADQPPRMGQNIFPRASELRTGQCVLKSGTILGPIELGVLATVGRDAVQVVPGPRVAILATGDELVEPPQVPGPGQIRNSNGPMLVGQVSRAGAQPCYLGIARDTVSSLTQLIQEGLHSDVLILAGGVSAGQKDLVPGVLQELGVRPLFHKIKLKPGKPLFFGVKDHPGGGQTLVFGLPGNPVSSFVCFELFVRPALRRLSGLEPGPTTVSARLQTDFPYRTDRPTYHPAVLEVGERGWQVQPVKWGGSADLHALTQANALLVIPAGDHLHQIGHSFSVIRLD